MLLALGDRAHPDHRPARDWLLANGEQGWATCPITENGFVRVMAQPSYADPWPPAQSLALLRSMSGSRHQWWPCDISIADPNVVDVKRVHGHRQITDVYLLALAVAHGGRLVTFDRRITLSAVRGATEEHLVVL